jgi:translation elongation factor EF-Tu-like GTPase
MAWPRDIEVTLTLLPTEHGGRNGPAFSGYRPQFYYSGHDWDGVHEYPDVSSVNPGDTVRAFIAFLSPASHLGKLQPGAAFLVREGQRVVGYGAVTRIVDLRRPPTEHWPAVGSRSSAMRANKPLERAGIEPL